MNDNNKSNWGWLETTAMRVITFIAIVVVICDVFIWRT